MRHFLPQAAALRVALAAADVLVDAVDALDHDLPGLAVDAEHLGPRAAVVAGDHFHGVVYSNVHHTTSLARLTIFMKFRSRSSRATAPKMRVPRGFLSLSMITTALRSKRT